MSDAPADAGWSLRAALVIFGGLMAVVVLVIAVGVRIFDRFDTVTELLIGAIVFITVAGLNGAVIWYLHSMSPKREGEDG
ncbi:MAG: hypothetical protein AAGC56_01030 [Pseudomonadota bacterium]